VRDIGGARSTEDGWAARHEGRSATNDSLVEEVATTLRYYAAQNGSVRVDRLRVCGGPAAAERLELLRTRLNLDVELWNPFVERGSRDKNGRGKETQGNDPPSVLRPPRFHGPSLAVATGLAMRSI